MSRLEGADRTGGRFDRVVVRSGPLAVLRGLLDRPLASYYLLIATIVLLVLIGLVMVMSQGGTALVVALAAAGMLTASARCEPDALRALHARPPTRWVRRLRAALPPLPRS